MTAHAVVDSPVGPLTLVESGGALAGLYLARQRHRPDDDRFGQRDDAVLPALREQLSAYFAGSLRTFDVPVAVTGTPFQQQVWKALRSIPYGQTRTYGQLAAAVGRPAAVRAVGAANGRNPVGIVVPCHRVIGADGSMTGYGGGIERKVLLLDLERRVARGPAAQQLTLA